MALSAYERKLRQLEREREEKRRQLDKSYPFLTRPFYQFAENAADWSEFQIPLEIAGVDPPFFVDDSGPHEHASDNIVFHEWSVDEAFEGYGRNSLGRAEAIAGLLIESGKALARMINQYKKEELQGYLKSLQERDTRTPEERADLFEEAARVTAMLAELDRNTRETIPVYQIK